MAILERHLGLETAMEMTVGLPIPSSSWTTSAGPELRSMAAHLGTALEKMMCEVLHTSLMAGSKKQLSLASP